MRKLFVLVLACLPLAAALAAPSDPTPMNLAAQRKALTDKKKEVRLAAVQQLGSWGNGASLAAPDLARLVHDDPDEAVANHAAMALAQIGPFGAKELAKAARSPTVAVRQRALVALSKMGPAAKEAVSVLRETLEDRQPGQKLPRPHAGDDRRDRQSTGARRLRAARSRVHACRTSRRRVRWKCGRITG